MNAPVNFEILPQELRDLIVDHISQIRNKSERIRALSSIALVSRRFRYWAHKCLFAAVALRGRHGPAVATAFRRLCQLKDLIIADPHSEVTGIASHIRSFTLSLGGRRSYLVPPLVEGDALPFIFQKIYRNGDGPCSLSISVFAPTDDNQLNWMALGHDFRCALLDIVRSARLSTLRLRGFSNLPDDILACSSIDHINFKNISIKHYMQSESAVSNSEPASCGRRSFRNCIQLYSMETDHSFPISHILDFTPTHSQPGHSIFHRLRKLTIKINDSDGFTKSTELLKSATSIENLEIKLNCNWNVYFFIYFAADHSISRHTKQQSGSFVSTSPCSQTLEPGSSKTHAETQPIEHSSSWNSTRHDQSTQLFPVTTKSFQCVHKYILDTTLWECLLPRNAIQWPCISR